MSEDNSIHGFTLKNDGPTLGLVPKLPRSGF